jgi:lipopolysaccharide export system permease protein
LKKIDKFILRSYLGPFVLTFFIAVFILLMQFVWKYVDDLVGKGLEWGIILKLLGLVSLTTFSLALPLAILLSSLMTFGNLGEFMELTAMKSSGISLQRAMRPVFILCVILSFGAFYFSNNVLPIANLKMKTLLADVTQKRPELNIKPGVFNNDIDKYVIRIGNKSNDGKILTDIMIYDHSRQNGNERLIIAEKGEMSQTPDKRYLELRLKNGYTYTEAEPGKKKKRNSYPFLKEQFAEDLIRFDLSIFNMGKSDENLYKKNYQMLNLSQLEAETDTLINELQTDKLYLPKVLFHGPFFDLNRKYSTILKPQKEKPQIKDSTIEKSADTTIKGADKLRLQIAVKAAMQTGDPNKIDSFLNRNNDKREPVVPVYNQKELADKKSVINNFKSNERLRIYEQAASALRSSKSSLDFSISTFEQEQERVYRHQIEWHRKFSLSFACLVLFLIGAPLGAIVRKGGLGMPVVFSLIFFVLYHMVSITGEKLAREAVLTPFWGMWLSSAVLLPIGLFLTYKSTRDSALFDKHVYVQFFRKLFSVFIPAAKR